MAVAIHANCQIINEKKFYNGRIDKTNLTLPNLTLLSNID